MIALAPQAIAEAIDARLPGGSATSFPRRVTIDSREAGPGDLFFGLPGTRHDGGAFAAEALRRDAWGVTVAPAHVSAAVAACSPDQVVFEVDDPVAALGRLATAWRRALSAKVIGVTGSTGKTSTKDILAALVGKSHSVVATPANLNTEIGLPLTVLDAPLGTDVLVLEMAMRGAGQIAQLAKIAEPDVGCIVNVGPVHLEQLGSIEAVASAKAELLRELAPTKTAVVPATEPLLEPYLRSDLRVVTFGDGGDVHVVGGAEVGQDEVGPVAIAGRPLAIETPPGRVTVTPSFREGYLLHNLLAAVACAQAVGAPVEGELNVRFSALRGELIELLGGVTLINDCYNANPVSMKAALENLAAARGRKLAVLGGMAELGADSDRYHAEVAAVAARVGVDLLICVGPLAGAYGDAYVGAIEHVSSPEAAAYVLRQVARPGDTVLVKGSRSVGLEKVAELLLAQELSPVTDRDAGVGA